MFPSPSLDYSNSATRDSSENMESDEGSAGQDLWPPLRSGSGSVSQLSMDSPGPRSGLGLIQLSVCTNGQGEVLPGRQPADKPILAGEEVAYLSTGNSTLNLNVRGEDGSHP